MFNSERTHRNAGRMKSRSVSKNVCNKNRDGTSCRCLRQAKIFSSCVFLTQTRASDGADVPKVHTNLVASSILHVGGNRLQNNCFFHEMKSQVAMNIIIYYSLPNMPAGKQEHTCKELLGDQSTLKCYLQSKKEVVASSIFNSCFLPPFMVNNAFLIIMRYSIITLRRF